jgi:prepilin-type N-terminal cleavage/methylation domain-containing protein
MKKILRGDGFTLVELLIVIALIAILSVAVLATINPIEQSNKAKDSTVQNDAAEVMNAYERYYTSKASYPWVDVDAGATVNSVDLAWFGRSDYNGAALCSLLATSTPNTRCATYKTNPGLLITTDELKDSFLEKGYTSLAVGDPNYNAAGMNYLWVNKMDVANHNSIFVCFIPKAKSNRTSTANLKKPVIVAGNVTGLIDTVGTDFTNGTPIAAFTFATPATSMFKCVP